MTVEQIEDLLSDEPYIDWSLSKQRKLLMQLSKLENTERVNELKQRVKDCISDWL